MPGLHLPDGDPPSKGWPSSQLKIIFYSPCCLGFRERWRGRVCLIAVKFVKCPLDSAKRRALHRKWPKDPSHMEVLNVTGSLPAAIVKHSGCQDLLLLSKYRRNTILHYSQMFFLSGQPLCCPLLHSNMLLLAVFPCS